MDLYDCAVYASLPSKTVEPLCFHSLELFTNALIIEKIGTCAVQKGIIIVIIAMAIRRRTYKLIICNTCRRRRYYRHVSGTASAETR